MNPTKKEKVLPLQKKKPRQSRENLQQEQNSRFAGHNGLIVKKRSPGLLLNRAKLTEHPEVREPEVPLHVRRGSGFRLRGPCRKD